MSVVEGLKIQIHVCGTYVLSVWFTLLIGFGSVWIFFHINMMQDLSVFNFDTKTYSIGRRVVNAVNEVNAVKDSGS